MKTWKLICLCLAALSLSCIKKPKITEEVLINTPLRNGLPDNPALINGYIISDFRTTSNGSYGNLTVYAAFGDGPRNLMSTFNHYTDNMSFSSSIASFGNINVGGNITVSNITAYQNSSFGSSEFHYAGNSSSLFSFDYSTLIRTNGNGSFKPLNLSINRGFPKITTNSTNSYSLNTSAGFSVEFGSFISNYDSMVVRLNNSNSINAIQKGVRGNETSISFSADELTPLKNTNMYYSTISFQAFNYSTQTIDSKVYVFELGNKVDKTLLIYP